jgi:hypothetical protein
MYIDATYNMEATSAHFNGYWSVRIHVRLYIKHKLEWNSETGSSIHRQCLKMHFTKLQYSIAYSDDDRC